MQRVDFHHHFVPHFYEQALEKAGGDPSGWKTPKWTVEGDQEFSRKERIAFSFLSLTAPGASVLPLNQQPGFCRQVNEFTADIRSMHSSHYGVFASIPSLLNRSSAHEEIIYALDVLKADGVILFTRYGDDNHYLGHPDFADTWELLDSRGAVVFVHPTHPVDTNQANPVLPQPMIDYTHETTRAAVDLITSDTMRKYSNIKVILSHAGGALPYLALRPAAMLPYVPGAGKETGYASRKSEQEFLEDVQKFYFDTALSAGHLTLDLLKGFAKPGHIVFGSDYPYAPTPTIQRMDQLIDEYASKDEAFVRSVSAEAAVQLFPNLAKLNL
ncbi:uncharacterized protein yc1106_08916 [Curvularia clavata]|uniref:6-methylsalicylate decarboxylase n=1 Tax=Curvularia clavata TaxID=95742 RepID=A0A9Q8ZE57_CURCL|nr:uncharacterized protein yc1106_08916 [Curvularia clavata]